MKIQFLGAAGTVTGSKYLLTTAQTSVLVDCGLFQGLKNLRLLNRKPLPFDIMSLDAAMLTHAHLDHSGMLPLLVKQGFNRPIYCTAPTRKLCEILLRDSAHLQKEDADFANRHTFSKHHPALPLYTIEDVEKTLPLLEAVPFNQEIQLANDVNCIFTPAGHILGAASVFVKSQSKSITFSGDVGRLTDPLMYPPAVPQIGDYLVLESTYGDRKHPDVKPEEQIAKLVNETIKRGGTVLIPSFAVGRAQTLCFILYQLWKEKKIPDVPMFVNSPMACSVTDLYTGYAELHKMSRDDLRAMEKHIQLCSSVEESKQIDRNRAAKIIISASGMATGGRVIHHLKTYGPDPQSLVLFAGYQAAGTRGEAMVNGATSVKIHGEQIPIKARVENLDTLSAHADYQELLTWLTDVKNAPKKTFLTHGEASASESMRKHIENRYNWDCTVPMMFEKFEL